MYRDHCRVRGVDPEVEKAATPADALVNTILQLMHQHVPGGAVTPVRARILRGWERYLQAFNEALAHGHEVHPSVESAFVGELYWKACVRKRRQGMLEYAAIYLRTGQGDRYLITRYHPMVISRVSPYVEIRCPVKRLLELYPQAQYMAESWRHRMPRSMPTSSAQAVACNVHGERIEDLARVTAGLLEANEIVGVRAERTGYVLTGLARPRRKA